MGMIFVQSPWHTMDTALAKLSFVFGLKTISRLPSQAQVFYDPKDYSINEYVPLGVFNPTF